MGRDWRRLLSDLGTPHLSSMVEGFWPILQQTAAVSLSWLIAARWAGHPQPVFAPVATVVGLNAQQGTRGAHAIRLLIGVGIGVLAAEVSQWAWNTPHNLFAALASAVFASLMVARALTPERSVMAQAAASAVIAVLTGSPHASTNRLVDAVIGVAVALLFSQLLLPAEPVAVLRRVERDALAHLAATVGLVTEGIHRADRKLTAEALSEMEETAFHLADLTDIRGASTRSAWLSPLHLRRLAAVKREVRHARRLELLSLSSLTLMRTILMPPPEERPTAHAVPHRFQQVLVTLSTDDGNAGALASGQMLDLVRSTAAATLHHEALNAVGAVLCLTAEDVLVYAGRGQREAAAIVRDAWREARTSHDTPDDAEGHDDRDA